MTTALPADAYADATQLIVRTIEQEAASKRRGHLSGSLTLLSFIIDGFGKAVAGNISTQQARREHASVERMIQYLQFLKRSVDQQKYVKQLPKVDKLIAKLEEIEATLDVKATPAMAKALEKYRRNKAAGVPVALLARI